MSACRSERALRSSPWTLCGRSLAGAEVSYLYSAQWHACACGWASGRCRVSPARPAGLDHHHQHQHQPASLHHAQLAGEAHVVAHPHSPCCHSATRWLLLLRQGLGGPLHALPQTGSSFQRQRLPGCICIDG